MDKSFGSMLTLGPRSKLIHPEPEVGSVAGKIECRERLGGLLRYYHRAA